MKRNILAKPLAIALSATTFLSMVPATALTTYAASAASAKTVVKAGTTASKYTVKVGKTKTLKAKVTFKKKVTKKTASKSIKVTTSKAANVSISSKSLTASKKKSKTWTVAVEVKAVKAGASKIAIKAAKGTKAAKKGITWTVTAQAVTPTPTPEPEPEPTPEVIATTAIALDKTEAEVTAGETVTLTASVTPENTTDTLVWTSSDESIATVKDGVVTGVAAGEATITATSGEFKAECKVTVKAADTRAKITAVKQTKANAIELTFDQDASKLVAKGDITIQTTDKTVVIPIDTLTFAADGKTAVASLSISLTDKKEYSVTLNEASTTFTASVGEVASIAIQTSSAEVNVETPIKYTLVDAAGIDVTSANDIDVYTSISIDGKYSSASISTPSKASLTMANVGDVANVTITYTTNQAGFKPITVTAPITCVAATATVGTPVYYVSNQTAGHAGEASTVVNGISDSAKFYRDGIASTAATIPEDGSRVVYFYAQKSDQSAIYYDSYEVSSSSDNVASATIATGYDEGKFTAIEVTGNTVGTATIVVKATKNGVSSTYTIPVTVTKASVLSTASVTATRSTISNAYDEDYCGLVKVVAYDNTGAVLPDTRYNVTYKVPDDYATAYATDKVFEIKGTDLDLDGNEGFKVGTSGSDGKYTAYGMMAGTYYVEVSIADNESDKVITQKVPITVRALPENAWDSTKGVAMTYQIELNHSTVDEGACQVSTKANPVSDTAQARLYATAGGVFAGYVRSADDGKGNYTKVTVGTQTASDKIYVASASEITNLETGVKYGNKFTSETDSDTNGIVEAKLYDNGSNIQANNTTSVSGNGASFEAVNITIEDLSAADGTEGSKSSSVYYVSGDQSNDKYFAKTGAYTVTFKYLDNNSKSVTKTMTLNVKNSLYIPKVDVTSRSADSLNEVDIVKGLSASVDLNNKTSVYDSINTTNFYKTFSNNTATYAAASSGKMVVKYVGVYENIDDDHEVLFVVPVNATFTAK